LITTNARCRRSLGARRASEPRWRAFSAADDLLTMIGSSIDFGRYRHRNDCKVAAQLRLAGIHQAAIDHHIGIGAGYTSWVCRIAASATIHAESLQR
jgi:hypothetical protein